MPQLDQVTFLSQYFWLCFFFFGFYLAISKHFLPLMGRILKFRKKKMNLSAEGVQSMQQENEKVRASSKAVVESGLSTGGNFLLSHLQRIESWLQSVVSDTNKTQWGETNTLYIKWIGGNSMRQQLALQGATPVTSPGIFLSIMAEKCRRKTGSRRYRTTLSSRLDILDQSLRKKTRRGNTEQASPQGGKFRTVKKKNA